MTVTAVGLTLWCVSLVLSIAWYVESVTCGRCFVSSYLAPFAVLGNLGAIPLLRRRRHNRS